MSILEQVGTSIIAVINSSDRINKNATTSSDFTINLGNSNLLTNIRRCVVKNFHGVNASPNIPKQFKTFVFEYNSVVYSVDLVPGQYTILEFMTELQAVINAAITPATVVISQDKYSKKLRFTFSAALARLFSSNSSNPSPLSSISGIITSTTTPNNIIVADRPPKLNGLTHCYLKSQKLAFTNSVSSDQLTQDKLTNIGWSGTGYGDTIDYEGRDDEMNSVNYDLPRDLRYNCDIKLVDSNDIPISFNGFDCELVLKLYRF